MKAWTGRVVITNEPGGGRKDWRVLEDLTYYDGETGFAITTRTGAGTDGASIPRFFWRMMGGPFSGKYVAAALIHDQLYRAQGLGILTRKQSDQIFRRAMLSCDVPEWKAALMYRAVRMGGEWPTLPIYELEIQYDYLRIEKIEDL